MTKTEIQIWLVEAYKLARIKAERDRQPHSVLGLVDGIRISFFAMAHNLPAHDILELHDDINRLSTETFRGLGI